jgi:homoserine O-acetyltransferase
MYCLNPAAELERRLAEAFLGTKTRFCMVSFTSVWLLPVASSSGIIHALSTAGSLLVISVE